MVSTLRHIRWVVELKFTAIPLRHFPKAFGVTPTAACETPALPVPIRVIAPK
jgi:hypothetical protein